MIYTVGGIKGGSGKTTVAVNLSVILSSEKRGMFFSLMPTNKKPRQIFLPGDMIPLEKPVTPVFNCLGEQLEQKFKN